MAPNTAQFALALDAMLAEASRSDQPHIDVNAGDLHRRVGEYPGPDHSMPVCCNAMRQAMGPADRIIESPPKGNGASLTIRFALPRETIANAPPAKTPANTRVSIPDDHHATLSAHDPDEFDRTIVSLDAGDLLSGRYRLEKIIGRGGMGVVWQALDKELKDKKVAIKLLPTVLIRDDRSVARLREEALRSIDLAHPHIVRLINLEVDQDRGGLAYLVMQYVHGKTLHHLLAEYPHGLPPRLVRKWGRQIGSALDYAHSLNVLHRDIKPSNIIINKKGDALLLDFGIAREIHDSMTMVTGRSDTSGTLPYMSPQQLQGEHSQSNDIYSLSATLYESLCGEPPFTSGDLYFQILNNLPPPIDGLPEAAANALMAGLAKESARRPASAFALTEQLHGLRSIAQLPGRDGAGAARNRRRVDTISTMTWQKGEPSLGLIGSLSQYVRQLNSSAIAIGSLVVIVVVLALLLLTVFMLKETPSPEISSPRITSSPPEALSNEAMALDSSRNDIDQLRRGLDSQDDMVLNGDQLAAGNAIETHPDEFGEVRDANDVMYSKQGDTLSNTGSSSVNPESAPDRSRSGLETITFEMPKNPKHLASITVPLRDGIIMDLVYIGPGEFTMGSPSSDQSRDNDETPHRVRLTKGYWLGQTEVTQAQWKAVMETSPWLGKESVLDRDDHPAVNVNWNDAMLFCYKLSRLYSGSFRLPTEAEWEFACRAETQTRFSFGNFSESISRYAWYNSNAHHTDAKYAQSVKTKEVNPFGLFDMHGNVYEWCQDWYSEYQTGTLTDPKGPSTGTSRVLRGGGWISAPRNCRSADRNENSPNSRSIDLGFRVALDPSRTNSQLSSSSKTIDLGGVQMDFAYIAPGMFAMGSDDQEPGRWGHEGPPHVVQLSNAFYIGITEVTQEQWRIVMGSNPSRFQSDDRPVEQITWNDAQAFCRALFEKRGIRVRLPSEAEWEFACRAGSQTRFDFGNSENELHENAWFRANSANSTHPVASRKPNAWGLYDMHGNVWEWCEDIYHDTFLNSPPNERPWLTGGDSERRMLRGGSFTEEPDRVRSASRGAHKPFLVSHRNGFRLVLMQD